MSSSPPPPPSDPSGRPDDDDYDLLTYGEAAARIVELLAQERVRLDELRGGADPDVAATAKQEQRIALLEQSAAHYRDQKQTADTFLLRFGLTPRSRA